MKRVLLVICMLFLVVFFCQESLFAGTKQNGVQANSASECQSLKIGKGPDNKYYCIASTKHCGWPSPGHPGYAIDGTTVIWNETWYRCHQYGMLDVGLRNGVECSHNYQCYSGYCNIGYKNKEWCSADSKRCGFTNYSNGLAQATGGITQENFNNGNNVGLDPQTGKKYFCTSSYTVKLRYGEECTSDSECAVKCANGPNNKKYCRGANWGNVVYECGFPKKRGLSKFKCTKGSDNKLYNCGMPANTWIVMEGNADWCSSRMQPNDP